MAQSCTYTFNGPDGKEVTIRGMAAMKAYLVDGGMEFFQTKGVRFDGLEKAEAKPSENITDFGEKLKGARKDRDAVRAMTKELTDEEIASLPLSKIWPAEEIDKIEDKFAAAVSYAARAEIPSKPRASYKVAGWVRKVKMFRTEVVGDLLNKLDRDTLLSRLREFGSTLDGFASKVTLLESIDRKHWSRIGSVGEYPDAYKISDSGEKVPTPFVKAEIDGKQAYFSDTKSLADVIEQINAKLDGEAESKKMSFEVRGRAGKYFINKKGDKEYRKLKTFDSTKEAFDYIKNNYNDLVAAWDDVKERDNVKKTDIRSDENRERTGKDWRKGKDATPQQFIDELGFRGVEFGNWVGQGKGEKERQGLLNQAYDALMDLADVVGIPPKAISLNGSMGLAFGSRGSGNYAAHFEPSNLVINLTKTRGAGSLAHEWFHALDNYFARQRGGEVPIQPGMNAQENYRRNNYITYKPEPMYVSTKYPTRPLTKAQLQRYHEKNPKAAFYDPKNWKLDPKHPEGVRPEVEARFAELVEALDASPMAQRAARNDKTPNDGYWSRIIERGARAFENYVIATMQQRGYQNDYLANVVPPAEFKRSIDRYPYLMSDEIAPVKDAFDSLFGTMQTKETDKGIALFRSTDADPSNQRITRAQADGFLAGFLAKHPGAPQITLVNTFDQLPATVQQEARNQGGSAGDTKGVFHRGQVYLVAGNHSTVADFEATVFHEVIGHAGVRALFGNEFVKTANRLFMQLGGQAGLVKIMQRRGMGQQASDYIKGIAQAQRKELDQIRADMAAGKPGAQRRWNDAIARFVLTEEVYAHIAEQVKDRPSMMDKMKELIGKVRQWLRDKGFAELSNMGEADILFMLSKARQSLRTPAGRNGGGGITRNGVTVSGNDMMTSDGRRLNKDDPDYASAMRLADLLGLRQEPGVTTFRNEQGTIEVDGIQRPRTNSEGRPIHPTEDGIRNFWRSVDGLVSISRVWNNRTKSPVSEIRIDSLERNADSLADLAVREPFASHGYGSLDIPSRTVMLDNMFRVIGSDNKIAESVVRAIPVNVMNSLFGKEFSSKTHLNDVPMFKDVLSINEKPSVPLGVNVSSRVDAFVRVVAFFGAERSFAVGGGPNKLLSAKIARIFDLKIPARSGTKEVLGSDNPVIVNIKGNSAGGAADRFHGFISTFGDGVDYTKFVDIWKSATGNNGAFDPNEAPITLRRAPSATQQQGQSARNKVADIFASLSGDTARTFNWWNRTIGSQYNKTKKSPEFKKVYDRAHDFIDDVSRFANEAADRARNILPHLDTWKDIGAGLNVRKAWADAKDYQAIAPAIFEGTLSNGTTGTVWSDEDLTSRFNLNEKQRGLYKEFREAVNFSLDTLAKSEMTRIARAAKLDAADSNLSLEETLSHYVGQVDEQIARADGFVDEVRKRHAAETDAFVREFGDRLQTGRYRKAVEVMVDRQNAEIEEAEKANEGLDELRQSFTDKADRIQQLKDEGYAPLMRFGQYTVDVVMLDESGKPAKNADGEQDRPFFGMFESEAEAREAERILQEEYPDYTVTRGVLSDKSNELFKGITPETAELFAKMLGTSETEGFQAYLKQAVANRSAMKRLIQRKGMEGFSTDIPRVLASFITSNARLSSGNLHFGEMAKAVADIPKTKGDVADEAIKLMQYIQNPQEEAAALRGLLFFNFLGGSVAAALVNTTQTLSTTLPYLNQFGARNAASAISKAMLSAASVMRKPGFDGVNDANLRDALRRASEEGIIDPQEIHLLMAESMGNGASSLAGRVAGMVSKDLQVPVNRFTRSLTQAWGGLFSIAEKYNRHVAFMAAWDVAGKMTPEELRKAGASDRYNFAKQAVVETQFEYSKVNRPNWARGAVGATLFTFKTFMINYLEFLKRLPSREKALAVGVLFMLSGLSGAPGGDDLDDLIDAVGQKLGYNWNNKAGRHAWLMETFGKDATNFIERGVSSFLPIDVSARLGMGNIIPGTGIFKKSEADKSRDVAEFFGPAGSLAKGAFTVFDDVGTGKNFGELVRPVMPKAYNDAYQAIDVWQTGYYRDSKGRKVVEADGMDAFAKLTGFQPNAVAEPRRVEFMLAQSANMVRVMRADIHELWSRGIAEGDREKVQAAQDMLRTWNEKNRETPIRPNLQSIQQRVRAMRMSSAERLVKATPKEMRGMVSANLVAE